ncbi:DUF4313 domain-containing protein [Methanobrevibacter sp.]|uniref:DUF4313 domain-containing protein n=1 Tax=Methanobrevibacter sp. TaxID=66852 RepID=UPI00388F2698
MKVNLYGTIFDVAAKRSTYMANNSLAVMLEDSTDGSPFGVLTVCLPHEFTPDGCAYVDTNNCPWAEEFIKENQLGDKLEFTAQSGFCTYPLYRFNLNKIQAVNMEEE